MSHLPYLSRTAGTHPMGKLVHLPNVNVAEPTLDILRRLAVKEGVTFSEFVRVYLEARAHGVDHVASVAAQRIQRIAGTGPAIGPAIGPRIHTS